MTKQEIEALLERVRTWPAAKQEDAAAILLALEPDDGPYDPTDEEVAAIRLGLAEAERGEFASDDEVQELLHRPWTR